MTKSFDTSNPTFVHGVRKAEDLVRLPGTHWIIASYFNLELDSDMPPKKYGPGPLQAIRMDTHEVRELDFVVDWDQATYPDCRQPPEWLCTHGLNVRALGENAFRLYACNHGGRHSVEIVDLIVDGDDLQARWRGGVEVSLEELNVWPNGVAPLPEEGFVLSGFNVATWRPGQGWERLSGYEGTRIGDSITYGPDGSGMSNGVEVSGDGEWIFIADSTRESVVRVPIGGGEPTVIQLSFEVDNLRWGEDGLLYACGTVFPEIGVEDIFAVFNREYAFFATGIMVMSIDPETLAVEEVVNSPDGLGLRYGVTTTALQVDENLWLGTQVGDRVAVLPVES